MAIYHYHKKFVSRSKGQSATAAAAYRAGERVHDEREGRTLDYTRKRDVIHTQIFFQTGRRRHGGTAQPYGTLRKRQSGPKTRGSRYRLTSCCRPRWTEASGSGWWRSIRKYIQPLGTAPTSPSTITGEATRTPMCCSQPGLC